MVSWKVCFICSKTSTGVDPKPSFFFSEIMIGVIMNTHAPFPVVHFHFNFELDLNFKL